MLGVQRIMVVCDFLKTLDAKIAVIFILNLNMQSTTKKNLNMQTLFVKKVSIDAFKR